MTVWDNTSPAPVPWFRRKINDSLTELFSFRNDGIGRNVQQKHLRSVPKMNFLHLKNCNYHKLILQKNSFDMFSTISTEKFGFLLTSVEFVFDFRPGEIMEVGCLRPKSFFGVKNLGFSALMLLISDVFLHFGSIWEMMSCHIHFVSSQFHWQTARLDWISYKLGQLWPWLEIENQGGQGSCHYRPSWVWRRFEQRRFGYVKNRTISEAYFTLMWMGRSLSIGFVHI